MLQVRADRDCKLEPRWSGRQAVYREVRCEGIQSSMRAGRWLVNSTADIWHRSIKEAARGDRARVESNFAIGVVGESTFSCTATQKEITESAVFQAVLPQWPLNHPTLQTNVNFKPSNTKFSDVY